MPNISPHPRRRQSRLTEVKWFIATVAVAGTMGFWVLFARQWMLQVAADSAPPEDTPEAPQQDNTLVIELPPMPTLIPTPTDLPFVASPVKVVAPLPTVQAPAAPQTTGKILLGGSAPSKNNNNGQGQKKPATRTRSSK
jgi:hypothetical protein